jgi:hypothetical protein
MIFKSPRLNDKLLVSTLLSTSLNNLRNKGFPVERILNLQKSKLRAAETAKRQEESKLQAISRDESSAYSQLSSLFPDIDRRYLTKLLANEAGSIAEIITRLSNQLLDGDYPKDPSRDSSSSNAPPSYSSSDNVSNPTPAAVSKPNPHLDSKPKQQDLVKSSPSSSSGSPRNPKSGGGESMLDKISKGGWAGGFMDSIRKAASGSSETISSEDAPITPDFTKNIEDHLKRSLASLSTETKDFSARVPNGIVD